MRMESARHFPCRMCGAARFLPLCTKRWRGPNFSDHDDDNGRPSTMAAAAVVEFVDNPWFARMPFFWWDELQCLAANVAVARAHREEWRDLFVAQFLATSIIGEDPAAEARPGDTLQLAMDIIENKPMPVDGNPRVWRKLVNLQAAWAAHRDVPPDVLLTAGTIKHMHAMICDGLDVPRAGHFRTTVAAAHGFPIIYERPTKITASLDSLLAQFRSVFGKLPTIGTALTEAAVFFASFLLIHPFGNGNGRVARLLASLLLEPFVVVPLILNDTREDYLRLVHAAQLHGATNELATYFLRSACSCAANAAFLSLP